jgi:deoxyribodipyrimidine photolyase-related protein
MYWFLGPEYRNNNQLQATRKLLPLFEDPNKTQMNCINQQSPISTIVPGSITSRA